MDVTDVLVDVVRTENGEGNHQHVDDMVGEQRFAVAPQELQQLRLPFWCAGHVVKHSLMGWPGNS